MRVRARAGSGGGPFRLSARLLSLLLARQERWQAVTATHLDLDLPPEVSDKLRRLTEETGRGASSLAGEAIADYVDRELAIIEGIRRGIDDMNAGRIVPHEEAMARIMANAWGHGRREQCADRAPPEEAAALEAVDQEIERIGAGLDRAVTAVTDALARMDGRAGT